MLQQLVLNGIKLIFSHHVLLSAIITGMIINSTIVYLDEFITLYLRDKSMPLWTFGLVMALAYLSRGGGSMLAEKLSSFSRKKIFFMFALVVFFGSQIAFGFVPLFVGLVIIGLLYILWGLLDVLVYSKLHHAAGNEYRATAESTYSLITRFFGLLFGLLFGIISDQLGTGKGLSYSSLITFVVVIIIFLVKKIIRKGK